jgi:hypothetical protein
LSQEHQRQDWKRHKKSCGSGNQPKIKTISVADGEEYPLHLRTVGHEEIRSRMAAILEIMSQSTSESQNVDEILMAGMFDLYVCTSDNLHHLSAGPERKKYNRDLNEILGAKMVSLLCVLSL